MLGVGCVAQAPVAVLDVSLVEDPLRHRRVRLLRPPHGRQRTASLPSVLGASSPAPTTRSCGRPRRRHPVRATTVPGQRSEHSTHTSQPRRTSRRPSVAGQGRAPQAGTAATRQRRGRPTIQPGPVESARPVLVRARAVRRDRTRCDRGHRAAAILRRGHTRPLRRPRLEQQADQRRASHDAPRAGPATFPEREDRRQRRAPAAQPATQRQRPIDPRHPREGWSADRRPHLARRALLQHTNRRTSRDDDHPAARLVRHHDQRQHAHATPSPARPGNRQAAHPCDRPDRPPLGIPRTRLLR